MIHKKKWWWWRWWDLEGRRLHAKDRDSGLTCDAGHHSILSTISATTHRLTVTTSHSWEHFFILILIMNTANIESRAENTIQMLISDYVLLFRLMRPEFTCELWLLFTRSLCLRPSFTSLSPSHPHHLLSPYPPFSSKLSNTLSDMFADEFEVMNNHQIMLTQGTRMMENQGKWEIIVLMYNMGLTNALWSHN